MTGGVVVAVDAGTTGVRSRAVFADGRPSIASYREFPQHFPEPGLVEHDARDIRDAVFTTLGDVFRSLGDTTVDAIGITNQRETAVAWRRTSGEPCCRAIVWQDRRTADRCRDLESRGVLPRVRALTGLVLDPYFSASKFEWMIGHTELPAASDLALGTVDSWILWCLTGGRVHATDPSNASRTMLFDITTLQWSEELCGLFGVPMEALPHVRPSSGRFGTTLGVPGVPDGIPISGIAGDQQAALFGQACFAPGMAKNTYGTGSFVLMNVGDRCPPPTDGMLTTIAWTLSDGTTAYALEGAIFSTGATIQWLRDGLGIIGTSAEIGPLAASVDSSNGAFVVPAFAGLGSPWWDPYARGTVVGISRGVTRAHIARAVVESIAYQTRDVIDAMTSVSGRPITTLRVDGGASVMDLLLQLQADQLGVPVHRPIEVETTAIGAAYLAGLAEGVWASTEQIADQWRLEHEFLPAEDRTFPDLFHAEWLRAVERSRHWARPDADD